MNKEAIIFTIDAGSSMDEKFIDSDSTRAQTALECLKLTLQQKLFNNASHQIGFAMFGQSQANTDDGNSTYLRPIEKPDLHFVRKVVELNSVKFDSDRPGGDIFEAIDFIVQRLIEHCGTKKYNKRAFLFTNGRGKTKITQSRLDRIIQKIKQNDIKLNIIPMDFMETYDYEMNELDDEVFAHPVQAQNSDLLIYMRRMCQQNIQIYPASLAIELYKKFRKKDTNPVALFKGQLQIAPNLSIDVCTYKAIRKQKLKSLSKYDLSAPFDPALSKDKEVEIETNYILDGNNGGETVPKENIINAYNYGDNLVPVNEIIENATKIFEDKNFTLLGFVDSEKVPRYCFLGEVDIVVPQKENLISRKLFSAFIYSMLMQKKYAIARYVPRNVKKGVNPRMVVLIPYRSAERQMFYVTELPTIEGVRDYPFNSLRKSTEKQQEFVKNLVEKMMLVRLDEQGREHEEVKIENMFNPFRQYFYQTIFYRALNDDEKDSIPPLDEVTRNYINPERRIYADTDDELKRIKKEFRFKVNEISRAKPSEKKTLTWKDITTGELSMQVDFESEQVMAEVGKKFTLDNQNDDKFNSQQPIVSFRKMVNNNKKDLVNIALEELSKYIQKRTSKNNTEQQNLHLVDCANEMRQACIQQKEAEYWDEWFAKVPKSLNETVFHLMKVSGLGFINRSNEELFRHDGGQMKPVSQEFDELD